MAGTLTISTLSDGTNSVSTTPIIQGVCRAWINYNGVARTIRGSYNISSVTVSTAGSYQLNFTVAMPDTNYAIIGTTDDTVSNGGIVRLKGSSSPTYTTTYCIAETITNTTPSNPGDSYTVSVAIHR